MGCCNEPVNPLEPRPPDPSQHVNYTRGMVLGVDDFNQEFAYLIGRQRWLARDALGYGTLAGLRIASDSAGADGLRIRVAPGSALLPSGQLVCVGSEQCCVLNPWLARPANAALVTRLVAPGSPPLSPPAPPAPGSSGTVRLHLVLCWAQCESGLVPVPGEPCRDDDQLMAPSRVVDHFKLELLGDAPQQREEDALRSFVQWLRANMVIVDASPPPPADERAWLAAIRAAARPWLDAAGASPLSSPPSTPPPSVETIGGYFFDLSPSSIELARDQVADFLRAAWRLWVTELRPLWLAIDCRRTAAADADCLLLAEVAFDVVWSGGTPTGLWQLAGSPPAVRIDESRRPVLASLRLMQEWMLGGGGTTGAGGAAAAVTPMASPPPPAGTRALTVATADMQLGFSDGTVIARAAAAIRLTLPPSTAFNSGQAIVIKNVDVAALAVDADATGGDTIDGSASLALAVAGATTLLADGAGRWLVIASI